LNVEHGKSSFTVFREPSIARDEPAQPISRDHCRARERAERAAAKCASSIEARRIHQEMAQAYARLAQAREER